MNIQELDDENRELRETLFTIREMIGDGIEGEDDNDEEFEE